jgi:hypothetical protein
MNKFTRVICHAAYIVLMACFVAQVAAAQTTGGTLRGTVSDPQGLPVGGVSVHLTNAQTQATVTVVTDASGIYNYPDLPVGTYSITVEKEGFQKALQNGVQVFSNQVTQVNIPLQVGSVSATVEVTAAAPLVQTATSQISNDFDTRQVEELPNSDLSGSPLNLALLAPGTTPQGAGVLGEGGSIGGTRPRMNSFTIDGVDDNRSDVNGHSQNVIQDSIAEFNLLTNQFSAEYGHSAGGQFNIITKSGTNAWHGDAWGYNQNRNYDAMDNLQKAAGQTQPSRFDYTRAGADIGGPIIHNKLFIYGSYQRVIDGLATQAVIQSAPTGPGLATLESLADPAVQNLLKQFPTASSASLTEPVTVAGTACAGGCAIPFGTISPIAPNYFNENDFIINGDATLAKHQVSFHVLYERVSEPYVNTTTPQAQFTGSNPVNARKYLFKDTWIVSNQMVNDFRASYSRFVSPFTVPPAFTNYPNVGVDPNGLDVGPADCAPQNDVINTYQVEDNMSYVAGKHTLKWGAEWLHWIALSEFLPRARAEWDYANINELVNDYVPTGLNGALRGAGSGAFPGNSNGVAVFMQDDWRITPRLTLNLGLRYEWYTTPSGAALQTLNSISNLPGTPFIFQNPPSDTNNFGPRLGFAYDPSGSGKWAIRGGFGISYDVTPLNFEDISLPPQLYTEQNPATTCTLAGAPAWCADFTGGSKLGKGFLAGGGLLQVNAPCTTQLVCRESTSSLMVPIVEPKVLTWSLGVQREVGWNSSVEVRYVGTRSLELPVQSRLNTQTGFEAGLPAIPTYLSASSVPAAVPASAPALAQWDAFENNGSTCTGPSPYIYGAQGFCGALVTGFPPLGSGIYHGGSVDFNHRVGHGLTLRTNYTYSKNMDDATNELFSSRVDPRRSQDWQNIGADRGLSALDETHKFTISWVYELPGMGSGFEHGVTSGWQLAGSWFAASGTPVTILNGSDSNGNGDSAGDRPIFNPGGTVNGGSQINYVCNAGAGGATSIVGIDAATGNIACGSENDANVVGYVAATPSFKYVTAGLGARSNVGRDTFRSPGINTWNMSAGKTTSLTERFKLQFRVEAFDIFNHRSFALAQPSVFQAGVSPDGAPTVNNALTATYTNIQATGSGFLNKFQFSGGARQLQFVLKLMY